MQISTKVFLVVIALLLIYGIGSTAYIISTRARTDADILKYQREAQELAQTVGRIVGLVDATSLGLERAIGRANEITDRNKRIEILISAVRSAVVELIGIVSSMQGEAPAN